MKIWLALTLSVVAHGSVSLWALELQAETSGQSVSLWAPESQKETSARSANSSLSIKHMKFIMQKEKHFPEHKMMDIDNSDSSRSKSEVTPHRERVVKNPEINKTGVVAQTDVAKTREEETTKAKEIKLTRNEKKLEQTVMPDAEEVAIDHPDIFIKQEARSPQHSEYKVSGDAHISTMNKPRYRKANPPNYPKLAKKRGQQGLVLLRVKVDEEGKVRLVEILESSGVKILDERARETVKEWIFYPHTINETPTMAWVNIPVEFTLQ